MRAVKRAHSRSQKPVSPKGDRATNATVSPKGDRAQAEAKGRSETST